ncbi:hypothetical protein ABT063_02150 [Streptomyces sp. NPDC002838]|uniref:DUF6907 domain-containing protein n=1 Tax=Streptomyces sp. NPDC002838 TaxID=3154436 RepID=UPI003332A346
MSTDLPVYGPTEPLGDEEHTPEVIVRVDFLMSREQLVTALGIAWAEIAGERDPESLSVAEVRHEVEAWLSVQAFHELDVQMERDAQRVFPPEQQRAMDILAAAVDRAYAAPNAPSTRIRADLPVQQPRYRDGTVTLQTIDHGEIVTAEPAWCTGHDDDTVGYLADITHNGPPITATAVTASHGEVEVMHGYISHAPHAVKQPEPHPVLYVALDLHASFDPEDGRHLTHALRIASTRLDRTLDDLTRLRGENR